MEVKEHAPPEADENTVILYRHVPTRLNMMHNMLSVYMAKDTISLVLLYYLDRVGLAVEWFDALRAGDTTAVTWFCTHITMINEGLSDEKFEEIITAQAHEAFKKRFYESYEEYTCEGRWVATISHDRKEHADKEFANIKEEERKNFVRDHFVLKSGWASIRCELKECGRVLAAAPLRTLLPIMAQLDKRQIPIRRAMTKYILPGYDICMMRLQREMKEVAALIPPLCHVKGRFPYEEKRNMLTEDRESFIVDKWGSLIEPQDIIQCELYRQAPPQLRLRHADYYDYYEQSGKMDNILVVGEDSWKGEVAIWKLSHVYHTGLYCQSKSQILEKV